MSESNALNDAAGCHLVDDGGPQVVVVEDAGGSAVTPQALWVRVGHVYDGGEKRDEPGIWVCYQEAYLAGPLLGPVLLTPAAWRKLAAAVESRLAGW